MEFIYILFAFVCGFGLRLVGLPALIGFLLAGFLLNFIGNSFEELHITHDPSLDTLATLGITLMLFTVGLKLNIKDLVKPAVWGSATLHSSLWISAAMVALSLLSWLGLGYFSELTFETTAALVFALSFSSTVCIVKILEENGEMKTRHGKIAIGVLIIQDLFAVMFLVVAAGKTPSIWALGLFALFFAQPLLNRLLVRAGHGEMLPLTGFLFALGGYELFELVGVKGDLGALVIGMLLAPHQKSNELAKALLSFKDLFLIGFFLTVGFTAIPNWEMVYTALILCLLLPIKFFMFYAIFVGLRLRARTAYLASQNLSNYSEFGLIVVALIVNLGWLNKDWLVILAISVSISFVINGLVYRTSHNQYKAMKNLLKRFERKQRLSDDQPPKLNGANILVIGLGRVGKGAFAALSNEVGNKVLGMDADARRVKKLQKEGLHVITGDGEDIDLWENMNLKQLELVLLALPSIEDICNISEQLKSANYQGKIAAIARYEDDSQALIEAGTDKVFNFFTEAGIGFAEESLQLVESRI